MSVLKVIPKDSVVACIAVLAVLAGPAWAEGVPLESARWTVSADEHQFAGEDGRSALFLRNGRALLNDSDFENGIIEFDVKFPDQRGFVGVRFRRQDDANYEDFYIRTHQGGNPDANQYSPTFNGLAGWQIYYGPQYATPVEYRHDEWTHVKAVISGDSADFYIDSETPVLHVADLKRDRASGGIELWTNLTAAHFANLSIDPQENAELIGTAAPEPEGPAGLVRTWLVSDAQSPEDVGAGNLNPDLAKRLAWSPLDVETNGVANLARIAKGSRERNIAIARIVVNADKAGVRKLRFGFSDRARVYHNGVLLFEGDDTFGSRDYRFLGTVGLFDAVYLPLKKGRNEIDFAVAEAFGGWAVTAAFDDLSGLTVEP